MDKIIKVKKSKDEVWIDLSNLPYKTNNKNIDYERLKNMGYIKAPFSYKGIEDVLYIKYYTHIPDSKFLIKYKGEEKIISLQSLKNVALDKITYNTRKEKGLIKRFNGKRYVDISSIPSLPNGTKDFSRSVGCIINYTFDNAEGTAKIIEYFKKENHEGKVKEYIRLEDDNGIYLYNTRNLLLGNLERIAKPFVYPYSIGDILGKFKVIDYVAKDYISYKGAVQSDRFIQFKCTECGMVKNVQTSQINNHSKDTCSDCNAMKKSIKELNKHRSKGESMVEQVLKQKGIKYIPEKSFDWSNRKRYDFYLPEDGCVIEVHGVQHYLEQNKGQRFHLTLEENKKNDKWKKDQATSHGLKYIEIDVRESDFDYIKESIINSILPTDNIDWSSVYRYMENGFIIEVIELYNSGLTPNEIGKKLNLSGNTIKKRLNKATYLGLARYTPFDYNIKQVEKKLERMKKERQDYIDKIRYQY